MNSENTELKTDFYERQAAANSTPLTRNIPVLIVVALILIGIGIGAYFLAQAVVRMPVTNAIKNITVTLKGAQLMDGVAAADIEVRNCNAFLVKDLVLHFNIEGPDGSSAAAGTVTLPQVFPMGSPRTLRHVKLGKLETESKHMHVELSDLKLGPKSVLSNQLQDEFMEAASAKDDDAILKYSELIKKAPNFTPAYVGLARAYLGIDDVPHALESAQQALKVDPGDEDAHYTMGLALQHNHDRKAAAREFEEALKLAPEDPDVQSSLQYL
ncbi:MAG TPA: tetratricopeptide repeat protein [Chroococcales cyanobacterium]